jgi:hypothetical protein
LINSCKEITSVEELERIRMSAMSKFLKISQKAIQKKYVTGALPSLLFGYKEFD